MRPDEEKMRKDNPEKGSALIRKVLLPTIIVLAILMTTFIVSIFWLEREDLKADTASKVTEISNVYELHIDKDLEMMKREARYIRENKEIRSAFTSSNRELLLNVSMQKMEEIRSGLGL